MKREGVGPKVEGVEAGASEGSARAARLVSGVGMPCLPAIGACGGCRMKAMMIGFAASIVIAIIVGVVMSNINPGVDERDSVSASARL